MISMIAGYVYKFYTYFDMKLTYRVPKINYEKVATLDHNSCKLTLEY